MIFLRQARRNAIKLIGERSSSLDLARGRLVLMSAFFVLAYMLLAARAFDLMVFQAHPVQLTDSGYMEEAPAPVSTIMRGDILDRNGELLATTIKTASLYADPRLISNPEKAAKGLAEIFPNISYGDILQKLQDKKRFVWLKRNLLPQEQRKVLELGEPGLAFQNEDRRVYPQGNLLPHVVGYTDIDNQGLGGIERGFNSYLSQGKNISLTVDIRLQHALRRELAKTVRDFNAQGGAGLIMDARTGDVLGAVSLPDFDPHDVSATNKGNLFNRFSLGTYELGSVFKIFSTAAYLETHDVSMGASFDARKPIVRGRFKISDYHAENRVLTIPEIFMYSSNIGAAMMGEAVGAEKLKNFYDDLGLTRAPLVELPEVGRPQVPDPWRDINALTASYGHGIASSPLQLTAAVSSIVNGGYLVKPHFVMNAAQGAQEDKSVRVISPETAHRVRQLMRLVVTDGTGAKAEVVGYKVGGKTGTAEKPGMHGGYDRARLLSSFVGAFPMDNPQYVIFLVVDEPKGNKASYGYATGGWVGAPAVSRVIASMVSILGMKPETVAQEADISNSLKQYISAGGHD